MTKEVCRYIDKFGEERIIHKDRKGRMLKKNQRTTPILKLNKVIGRLIGKNIKKFRKSQGLTLVELAISSGIATGSAKERMFEIESGSRHEGIRLGTLYAVANALNVRPSQLLPNKGTVFAEAGIVEYTPKPVKTIAVME